MISGWRRGTAFTADRNITLTFPLVHDTLDKLCSFVPLLSSTSLGIQLQDVGALVQNVNVALHQAVCIWRHFVHHQSDLSVWATGQSDAIESLDIFWWGLRGVMEACFHSTSKADEVGKVGEEPI